MFLLTLQMGELTRAGPTLNNCSDADVPCQNVNGALMACKDDPPQRHFRFVCIYILSEC